MSEDDDIPKISGYLSVKEAAQALDISEKMVYFYIENKRLQAVRASNLLLIPVEEIEKFEQKAVGRPRTRTPGWRRSTKDNSLFVVSIDVKIKSDKRDELIKKLDEIRQKKLHNFSGTIARYIIEYETSPDKVEIQLIWKTGTAPDEPAREEALEAFRRELADVLDWSTAQYNHGIVLMHT
jgi:excisionase family DNA binding protein